MLQNNIAKKNDNQALILYKNDIQFRGTCTKRKSVHSVNPL